MFKVLKKDGSLQDFDRNKIISAVVNSGASYQEAMTVANEVESWLPGVAENEVVNHNAIRAKVLESLRAVNTAAADSFESYRK